MLAPRKVKYRKPHRGNRRGMAARGDAVAFGTFGLKALENGWITSRQIEASRVAIARKVRKFGRMWIRIFPDKAVTQKPAETRMGKGKGAPEYWVCVVKPGRILFEIEGVSEELAAEAFRLCSHKLPIKTRMVTRREAMA
ncbi:50S ribosomal protein L16 [Candidatus Neomarinimicrobiota bacterium]